MRERERVQSKREKNGKDTMGNINDDRTDTDPEAIFLFCQMSNITKFTQVPSLRTAVHLLVHCLHQ